MTDTSISGSKLGACGCVSAADRGPGAAGAEEEEDDAEADALVA